MNFAKYFLLFGTTIAVLGFGSTSYASEEPDLTHIPNNISIDGVDVSGLTVEEADKIISESMSTYDDVSFKLNANKKSIKATGKDLGIMPVDSKTTYNALLYGRKDNIIARYKANKDIESGKGKNFELTLTSDWNKVNDFLESHRDEVDSNPVNNSLKRENNSFTFIEGSSGVVLDAQASASAIADFISNDWQGQNESIELVAEIVEPKGSKELLSRIKDPLGSYSTNYASSASGRAANINNGTERINGSIIYPGQVYSVSDALGKLNADNGYHLAPSYENGATVESYGGGVCQISTTLYNAVIRAELEIVERSAHSMVVDYVSPSMDAAIATGVKDFKFSNNRDVPVYVEGYTSGGNLYFNIFGEETRPANRTVSFESEILSTTQPVDVYQADPSLPIGTISRKNGSHTGYTARLWKIVTVDGQEESRTEFNNSSYRVSNAVYSVGIMSDNGEASASVNAAIATQDKASIEAAAGAWSAEAVAQRAAEEAAAQAAAEEEKAKEKEEDKKPNKKNEDEEEPAPEPIETEEPEESEAQE